MDRFSDKKEVAYLVTGLLGFGLIFFMFLYSMNFLIVQLGSALNPDLIKPPETVKFNLDSIKDLDLPSVR